MIAALLAVLFLGGSSFFALEAIDVYQDRAKDAIVDVDRRSQADDIFDQMKDAADSVSDAAKVAIDKLDDLASAKDVDRPDVDAAVADYWKQLQDGHRSLIDNRFELKEVVTRDEWEAIFGNPPSVDQG